MLHKTHKIFRLQWTVFLASLGFFWEAVLFQNLHHIWGNYDNCIITVFIDFPSNSKMDALFHFKPFDYSCTDWEGLHYHLRDVTWEEIFKFVASAAAAAAESKLYDLNSFLVWVSALPGRICFPGAQYLISSFSYDISYLNDINDLI